MTQDDQITLVNELCMRMALDIGTKINEGKIPKDWDGHELRVLIADKAAESAARSTLRKEPRGKRARAYRNIRTTTDL